MRELSSAVIVNEKLFYFLALTAGHGGPTYPWATAPAAGGTIALPEAAGRDDR